MCGATGGPGAIPGPWSGFLCHIPYLAESGNGPLNTQTVPPSPSTT